NTAVIGTYTITYNVSDSEGLAADTKTRTVKVNPVQTECNDGKDNDGDGKTDYPEDSGCDNAEDNDENEKPVITISGANPLEITLGSTFTDPGATASDPEDGNITASIVKTGTVNTAVIGTYTITYNVSDSEGLAADTKTRTVKVVTACADGIDNDGDGKIDFPADLGCDNINDNDENEKPVITVLGDDPLVVSIGSSFVDPSATATDSEDGDLTTQIVSSSTVDINVTGTYTITYNVSDSKGLAADPKTRTVKVVAACADGIDNDGDGKIDFPEDTGCNDPEDETENNAPTITLLGDVLMTLVVGTPFVDPGATAHDPEDGDLTPNIVASGAVNPQVGTYTITYTVSDSSNLAAAPKTRTVNITPGGGGGGTTPPQCSDGGDNDSDGFADYPRDPGCESSTDNDERDTGPSIALRGDNPMTITVGVSFTDPGATASDPEEGDISSRIVVSGSVNANTIGTYTLSYNVSDAQGHSAPQVNRTVNVVSGGGGGSSSLSIFNERLQLTGENTVVITWDTNLPATSRVVYGLDPVSALSTAPLYGYGLSTATATDLVTSHSMTINGLPAAATAYFRPVSSGNAQTAVGIELTRGGVLGETSCNYLRSYLRLGYQNDSVEVTKLQTFLRDEENFVNLKITGFFDIETDRAVRAFQDKYEVDVLRPWNLPENTGYVYYTTQKKINESHCKRNFPLTVAQVGEIAAFRELIARLDREGGTPVAPAPIVGTTQPKSPAIEVSMPAPIAGTPTATTSMSGRVSLSDLLATMPHVNAPMNTSQEALTGTEGEVAGISTKRGLAATIESISDRMDLSERMVYVALFLILLFLILAIILLRRYYRDGSDEMKV
ncbi:MAG: DUF5011 domain-containing protein, partial [Candidatus Liptonbacteria bacterium]|nr:DUF5011 domain-containing protein [Candidatus Liptonbacteria bacterium]